VYRPDIHSARCTERYTDVKPSMKAVVEYTIPINLTSMCMGYVESIGLFSQGRVLIIIIFVETLRLIQFI